MGHLDRFDPSKMATEGNTMFPNGESDASHAAADAIISQLNSSIEEERRSECKAKRRRKDVKEWHCS